MDLRTRALVLTVVAVTVGCTRPEPLTRELEVGSATLVLQRVPVRVELEVGGFESGDLAVGTFWTDPSPLDREGQGSVELVQGSSGRVTLLAPDGAELAWVVAPLSPDLVRDDLRIDAVSVVSSEVYATSRLYLRDPFWSTVALARVAAYPETSAAASYLEERLRQDGRFLEGPDATYEGHLSTVRAALQADVADRAAALGLADPWEPIDPEDRGFPDSRRDLGEGDCPEGWFFPGEGSTSDLVEVTPTAHVNGVLDLTFKNHAGRWTAIWWDGLPRHFLAPTVFEFPEPVDFVVDLAEFWSEGMWGEVLVLAGEREQQDPLARFAEFARGQLVDEGNWTESGIDRAAEQRLTVDVVGLGCVGGCPGVGVLADERWVLPGALTVFTQILVPLVDFLSAIPADGLEPENARDQVGECAKGFPKILEWGQDLVDGLQDLWAAAVARDVDAARGAYETVLTLLMEHDELWDCIGFEPLWSLDYWKEKIAEELWKLMGEGVEQAVSQPIDGVNLAISMHSALFTTVWTSPRGTYDFELECTFVEGACADGLDDDDDGAIDCADADCADEGCKPQILEITPGSSGQPTSIEVDLLGHFASADGSARVWAGDLVEVTDAVFVDENHVRATLSIPCAQPAGPLRIEFAMPWEPEGTGCDSPGRACSDASGVSLFEVTANPACTTDDDGDGVPAAEDCDDTSALVRPGAAERCDGLDTDCDPTSEIACSGPTYHSGTLPGSEVWTLASGPHVIRSTVTVPAGATLTIEPGVDVLVASGTLTVLGALDARGTEARPVAFGSDVSPPTPGDWGGIRFAGGATGTLEHADVGWADVALWIEDATPTVRDSVFHHAKNEGLRIDGPPPAAGDDSTRFTDNTFTSGAGARAAHARLDRVHLLNVTNRVTGNAADEVEVTGDLSEGHVVISDVGATYRFQQVYGDTSFRVAGVDRPVLTFATGARAMFLGSVVSLTVADGGRVVVEPGAELLFSGGGITVGDGGFLEAIGLPAVPIVLDSAKSPRAPGDWGGVTIRGVGGEEAAVLSDVEIRNATVGLSAGSASHGPAPLVTVRDCTIADFQRWGFDLIGAPPPGGDDPTRFTGNTVTGGAGVRLAGDPDAAARATFGRLGALGDHNEITGNSADVILVDSNPDIEDSDVVIRNAGAAYLFPGVYGGGYAIGGGAAGFAPTVTVASGVRLVVQESIGFVRGHLIFEPGAEVAFAKSSLTVPAGAELTISGTPAEPVVFTSGMSAPAPGDWYGISLAEGSTAHIAGATFRWPTTAVHLWPGAHELTDSRFEDCEDYGLWLEPGASPTLSGNTFARVGVEDVHSE